MIKDLEEGKFFIDSYDKLMIPTGTMPVLPPLKGKEGGFNTENTGFKLNYDEVKFINLFPYLFFYLK